MNKVEKIKVEIERRYEYWKEKESNSHSIESESRMSECQHLLLLFNSLQEDPVSNDLEEAAKIYEEDAVFYAARRISDYFKAGAQWQKENLWKDAQGDDLPEIDRDVIVLVKSLPEREDSLLKVSFAHRPPKYWMGKSISTGEITRYEPMRYDKGQWSKPAVVWWLDVELPKNKQ